MTSFTEKREGYKKTELGWIPEDWDVSKLENLGELKNGINKIKEDFGQGYPFVNLMDVFGKAQVVNQNFGLVNASEKDLKDFNLLKGDVLFVRSSVKPTGVGLTSIVVEDLENTIFSGFLIRFRGSRKILADTYKKYCFHEAGFRQRLIAKSTVSANTNINQQSLRNLLIIIPPLSEQQKIAAILSTVDEKIDAIDTEINAIKKLKKALMRQLLTRGIGHTEFKETELGWIPKEWEVKKLIDIASKEKGNIRRGPFGGSIKKSDFIDSGYKIYEQKNVIRNNLTLGNYYINEDKFQELSDFEIKENDFLISGAGTIGKIILVKNPFKPGIINQALVRLRLDMTLIDNNFFKHQFESDNMQKKIIDNTQGGAMKNLVSMDEFKKIIFILPSLSEQQKIADILSTVDEKLDILREKKETYQTLKKGLMQQLLTGAIRVTHVHLNAEIRD